MTAPAYRQIARALASYGLPGALVEFPDKPLSDIHWRTLLSVCAAHRINGLLLQAVVDGALPATDEQIALAHDEHLSAMTGVILLERALLLAADQLSHNDIEFRVLKGSGVARLDYADPALRSFCDIDLLVQSEQFDQAVAALVAQGNVRRYPEPRQGFDRRFSKGASFVTPEGFEIDLHRTFVMGPFGLRVDLADLWRTSTPFEIGGRKLPALGHEERFLHACYHAALGDPEPRLVPQRDIAEMLLFGSLNMQRVNEVMARWKGEAVVARAVRSAWETLRLADVVALSAWASRYQPTDRDRKDLAVYTSRRGNYAAKSVAAVAAIPGFKGKLAFATALVFPQDSYVHGRHRGSLSRWRRAAGGIRDGRAPL